MVRFVDGSLLDARVDALVNAVNTVGVMGKGLALQFKRAYPANTRAYEAACERGDVTIGTMLVFATGTGAALRYIIDFPTKQHWRSPSQLDFVERGLDALVSVVRDHGVQSVAVPALGAGIGGLDWTDVRPLVERKLSVLDDVDVLVFEPRGSEGRGRPEENATAEEDDGPERDEEHPTPARRDA